MIQFESKSDKYFLLNSSALRIIDVESRFLLKNIAVNASKVMLDSCDHLILMINSNSLITVCDFYIAERLGVPWPRECPNRLQ